MTKSPSSSSSCGAPARTARKKDIHLAVVAPDKNTVRPSRTSKWRTAVLIGVHLIVIGHILHWVAKGKTISPVEPSEAMYTLNHGHLNAGFLFFLAAILSTVLLGRFFCGWGCHVVAYQDFCAWIMKKLGVKPKPFRSRILILAPLALAIYMFIWPTVYRLFHRIPAPHMINDMLSTDFWQTFPGPVMAVLTFAVCGFAIVYFLGAKGFCTYGCPYGGFFGFVDPVAPGRIRVTDDCEHCGHCTAVCTSNVKVHEEVALYGMVVDPGCMKCMDCISVCPNDALYFGFGKPALGAKPSAPRKETHYDFALWEEFVMVLVGLAAFFIYRGLYGQVPMLMAMGMAAIVTYVVMKLIHVIRDSNVRLQNLNLRRGRRLTRSGLIFVVVTGAWLTFTAHAAAVRIEGWRGSRNYASLQLDDSIWTPTNDWWNHSTPEQRSRLNSAIRHFERANRWGIMRTDIFQLHLVQLYLAGQNDARAEETVRQMINAQPRESIPRSLLAAVLNKRGDMAQAEASYRDALKLNPSNVVARKQLANLLLSLGRADDAMVVFREHVLLPRDGEWVPELAESFIKASQFVHAREMLTKLIEVIPSNAYAHWYLGVALEQLGQDGLAHLIQAVTLTPDNARAQYDLGQAFVARDDFKSALKHYQQAIAHDADFGDAHYQAGAVLAQLQRPAEALPYVREAVRLNPSDPMGHAFLEHLLRQVRDK